MVGGTGVITGGGTLVKAGGSDESTPICSVVDDSVMDAGALGTWTVSASGPISLETCSMAASNKERASSYNASRIGKKSFSPSALREDPSLVISDVLQKWRREW